MVNFYDVVLNVEYTLTSCSLLNLEMSGVEVKAALGGNLKS